MTPVAVILFLTQERTCRELEPVRPEPEPVGQLRGLLAGLLQRSRAPVRSAAFSSVQPAVCTRLRPAELPAAHVRSACVGPVRPVLLRTAAVRAAAVRAAGLRAAVRRWSRPVHSRV